jgi:hypothetical protein
MYILLLFDSNMVLMRKLDESLLQLQCIVLAGGHGGHPMPRDDPKHTGVVTNFYRPEVKIRVQFEGGCSARRSS